MKLKPPKSEGTLENLGLALLVLQSNTVVQHSENQTACCEQVWHHQAMQVDEILGFPLRQ